MILPIVKILKVQRGVLKTAQKAHQSNLETTKEKRFIITFVCVAVKALAASYSSIYSGGMKNAEDGRKIGAVRPQVFGWPGSATGSDSLEAVSRRCGWLSDGCEENTLRNM